MQTTGRENTVCRRLTAFPLCRVYITSKAELYCAAVTNPSSCFVVICALYERSKYVHYARAGVACVMCMLRAFIAHLRALIAHLRVYELYISSIF